jgi:hypothetical protein
MGNERFSLEQISAAFLEYPSGRNVKLPTVYMQAYH